MQHYKKYHNFTLFPGGEILWKWNSKSPKTIWRLCLPKKLNLHIRKLGEITVFFAV